MRPVLAEVLSFTTWVPGTGVPPCHVNCDQRLARSKVSDLARGKSLRTGMFNSRYSASVDVWPKYGFMHLSEVRHSCSRLPGVKDPSTRNDSAPAATLSGPPGNFMSRPVIFAVKSRCAVSFLKWGNA